MPFLHFHLLIFCYTWRKQNMFVFSYTIPESKASWFRFLVFVSAHKDPEHIGLHRSARCLQEGGDGTHSFAHSLGFDLSFRCLRTDYYSMSLKLSTTTYAVFVSIVLSVIVLCCCGFAMSALGLPACGSFWVFWSCCSIGRSKEWFGALV